MDFGVAVTCGLFFLEKKASSGGSEGIGTVITSPLSKTVKTYKDAEHGSEVATGRTLKLFSMAAHERRCLPQNSVAHDKAEALNMVNFQKILARTRLYHTT